MNRISLPVRYSDVCQDDTGVRLEGVSGLRAGGDNNKPQEIAEKSERHASIQVAAPAIRFAPSFAQRRAAGNRPSYP